MKAVGIIIYSPDRKSILLSKRSKNEENEIGKWENVGGKLEENETFEEAVIREAKEELAVEIADMKDVLTYGSEDSDNCVKIFEATIEGEPTNMEPYYCDDINWYKISELSEINLAKYCREDFVKLGFIKN